MIRPLAASIASFMTLGRPAITTTIVRGLLAFTF